MGRSPGFASAAGNYGRPIKTRFRYGFISERFNLRYIPQLAGSLCKRHAVTLNKLKLQLIVGT